MDRGMDRHNSRFVFQVVAACTTDGASRVFFVNDATQAPHFTSKKRCSRTEFFLRLSVAGTQHYGKWWCSYFP